VVKLLERDSIGERIFSESTANASWSKPFENVEGCRYACYSVRIWMYPSEDQ